MRITCTSLTKALIPLWKRPLLGLPVAVFLVSTQGCLPKNSEEQIPLALQLTGVPEAWPITQGEGVRVALLSTGIDRAHPDLPAVVAGRSFVSGDATDFQDRHGVGTMNAGIIAARHNNIGIKGIAPKVELLVGKVLEDNATGTMTSITAGMQWAVAEGADIILADFGATQDLAWMHDAVDAAAAAGVLVIAPTGYSGTTTPYYPASYASAQSIGAVDEQKARMSSSNYGDTLSVMAPGRNVLTTAPVGTGLLAQLTSGNHRYDSNIITGSLTAEASGTVYYCGSASGDAENSCPDAVAGHIAHVRRGTVSMQDKALHAQAKGAVGLIISNNTPGNFNATLNYDSTLVAITISQADGDSLQALTNPTATVAVKSGDLLKSSGTTHAAAHAAGVAALIKSANPALNNAAIRQILETSAEDLGATGFDSNFGYGLINAARAVEAAVE